MAQIFSNEFCLEAHWPKSPCKTHQGSRILPDLPDLPACPAWTCRLCLSDPSRALPFGVANGTSSDLGHLSRESWPIGSCSKTRGPALGTIGCQAQYELYLALLSSIPLKSSQCSCQASTFTIRVRYVAELRKFRLFLFSNSDRGRCFVLSRGDHFRPVGF